jgi:hypothetical protein
MNILNDNSDITKTNKPEIEQVEKKKQEYYLLGTFLRTRGLRLFGYNNLKNEVFEVKIQYGNTIHLIPQIDGSLLPIDFEAEKCTVDSRFEYFEALNFESANKRVLKYKQGKLSELCNLRKSNPDGIRFF